MGLVFVGVVLLLGAGGLLFGAGRAQRRQAALAGTETTTCADLTQVLDTVTAELGTSSGRVVEIVGTTKAGPTPLTAPLSDRPCVWHRSTITEHYREYEWRGEGEQRHRELVDKSREISEETSHDTFLIDDTTGTIRVDLDGVDIDQPEEVLDRRVAQDEELGLMPERFQVKIGPITLGSSEGTTGYQKCEWILPVGAKVFATGEATKQADDLVLQKPRDKAALFIVSRRDEAEIQASTGKSLVAFRIGTIAAAVGGIGCLIASLLV